MNCDTCGGEVRIVSLHGVTGINRLHQCEKCLACWPVKPDKSRPRWNPFKSKAIMICSCGGRAPTMPSVSARNYAKHQCERCGRVVQCTDDDCLCDGKGPGDPEPATCINCGHLISIHLQRGRCSECDCNVPDEGDKK